MSFSLLAPVIALCLLAEAFFSGAEIALLTADRAVLTRLTRAGSRSARQVERFLARPQWFLATTLVGGTLCLVLAAVPTTLYSLSQFKFYGPLLAFGVLAPLFLLFGRILPKVYFQPRANKSALRLILMLRVFFFVFSPLVALLIGFSAMVQAMLGGTREEEDRVFGYTRDELKLLLTGPAAPIPDKEGRQMVDRIFEFSETLVEDVMIPLVQMEALEETATVGEALRKISSRMHSHYPVYRDRIDNVIGRLETFDLLEVDDLFAAIASWVREVKYAPFNQPVDELLFAMQRENFSFAVVVDEYGGCIGIITREDILEEIVGEIQDEYDKSVDLVKRLDDNRVVVNARMELTEVREHLGFELPEGDFDTLAGFLLAKFRRVPRVGERCSSGDLIFTIAAATPRGVQEVLIEKKLPAPPPSSPEKS